VGLAPLGTGQCLALGIVGDPVWYFVAPRRDLVLGLGLSPLFGIAVVQVSASAWLSGSPLGPDWAWP